MPSADMSESSLWQQRGEWGGGGRLKAGRQGGRAAVSGEKLRGLELKWWQLPRRRQNSSGSSEEEFIVVILKCLGGNAPFWESDVSTSVVNIKLAGLLHFSISGREAGLVCPLYGHGPLFGWAPAISNHTMGVGEIKNEKQHLSGTDYLYHALRPTKQMGKLRRYNMLFNVLPWKITAVRFKLEFVWITIPSSLLLVLPYLVQMWITMTTSFFLSWNPLVVPVCTAEGDTTSFLTVLGADSRTFKEWHQATFLKVISCPWSPQKPHSLRMCRGRKQPLLCQARDVWGSCNRQMSVCVCLHPLWQALLVNTHTRHLAKNKPGLLGCMTHAWTEVFTQSQ